MSEAEHEMDVTALDLAKSLRATYQTLVDTAIATQDQNAKLAQNLLEIGMDEMRAQTESAVAGIRVQTENTRTAMHVLADQSQKQRQAFEGFARHSVDVYMDFLHGTLSYYQKGLEFARQATE